MMMAKLIVVAVACLFILCTISGVFTQGNMDQRDSVRLLRNNRNMGIIPTCPLAVASFLSCDVTANRLTIGDGVYLRRFDIVINTCNSSLSPVFEFSNGATNRSGELRCSTKIPLGQLNIMFDLDIFTNQTTNLTMIGTAVSAWQGGQDIKLFRRTNLILSGQKPFADCIAEGGLIRPPFQCNTGVIVNSFSALSTVSVAIAVALVNMLTNY